METWITAKIRQAARHRVMAWAFFVTLALVGLWLSQRYFYNFFKGPFTMQAADIAQINDPIVSPRYFVRVTGSKAIPTGLQQITVTKQNGRETSRYVSAQYYALELGDRFLLVKSGRGPLTTFEGTLDRFPLDVASRFNTDPETAGAMSRFYPMYLNDDTEFRVGGYIGLGVLAVFLFVLVRFGSRTLKYFRDPSQHPLMQRVSTWGEVTNIAMNAQREFESPRFKTSSWRMGDNYLIRSSAFSFDLLHLHHLIWAYKKVTKHSVNFIPTGKTYAVVLICYGGTAEIAASEKVTEEMLGMVAQRSPWAILGYSEELAKAWKKDRDAICAAVDQRRQEAFARA